MSIRRNPIAWLALFVALGGTSYAAAQLPANSVGTRQLRSGAVTGSKVKRGSITAGALSPATIRTLRREKPTVITKALPPSGPCGSTCSYPPGTSQSGEADCPSGTHVVGGGFKIANEDARDADATTSAPTANANGWHVTFTWTQEAASDFPGGTVYVVCLA